MSLEPAGTGGCAACLSEAVLSASTWQQPFCLRRGAILFADEAADVPVLSVGRAGFSHAYVSVLVAFPACLQDNLLKGIPLLGFPHQEMTNRSNGDLFIGSQPVSLDIENLNLVKLKRWVPADLPLVACLPPPCGPPGPTVS